MDGGDQNAGNGHGGSRWNPTKEQINMLESLYKQGLRTPTAEQIQQITFKLRDFGHIEGKNVFYWFQNHKARQRQKQKQENFAYFNQFLHATPLFPPYQNVVCSPSYMPPPKNIDPGFYQLYPKGPLPTAAAAAVAGVHNFKRFRPTPDQTIGAGYNKFMHEYPRRQNHHDQETLDLFPIHPTGVLQSKNGGVIESDNIGNKKSTKYYANTQSSSENYNDCFIFRNEKAGKDNHFFDFFCKS